MAAFKYILYLTLIFIYKAGTNEINLPKIQLPLGEIEGEIRASLNDRPFYSFEGVPYASPPIGKHKFKEAIAPKPWVGTLKTNTIYKCLQYNHLTPPGQDKVTGDEDCLYLNIYTPILDPNANLDVIVYIHGGAFMFNYGGMQGPEYLLDKDVVYVNLNYRLGPLGFLSTENNILPGNLGIRDQIFALKWIQNNIHFFGGNPKSVTIIGMSAGGASVHLHYLSPKSKGLFHKGFSQSGTALCPWVLVEKPLEKTKRLIELVGCTRSNLKESVDCLSRRPARQLVAAVKHFQPWLYNPFSPFGVVIDSWATDPVLPEHPYILLKNGKVNDAPWISSYTNSEGLYPSAEFYRDDYLDLIDKRWNELMPLILDYNNTVDIKLMNEISNKIRQHYMENKPINKQTFLQFNQIISDRIFIIDIEKTVRLQAAIQKSPIYMYYFTYRGTHSWSERFIGNNVNLGASHADDTMYLFKMALDTTSTPEDLSVIKLFVDMVTAFAKTGKPNVGLDWTPINVEDGEKLSQLVIAGGNNLKMQKASSLNAKFWDMLPIMENEKLFPNIVKTEL